MIQLNPQQQKAVNTTKGALLIIAGAGSGKTRVITERLANIVETELATPEQTLTVTFTNKAASEIRERVKKRLTATPERSKELIQPNTRLTANGKKLPFASPKKYYNFAWMGTFHSIAVKLLRRHSDLIGIDTSFSIYDYDDQITLMRKIMKEQGISTTKTNPKAILSGISSAKQELLSPKQFERQAQGYYQEKIAPLYLIYQQKLRANNSLDFDDLLLETVRLLQEGSEILERYHTQFKYIMVDEYQDTNQAQYMIVKLLAQGSGNICVVGDDDQSIYAWRGANIRNILEFEQDFKDVTVIKLEQNYRSTGKILEASSGVVAGISNRKQKKLWTDNSRGDNLTVYQALDEKDEAYWVAEQIVELAENHNMSLNEIAILYRMNAQSREFEEALLKSTIPYQIVGNVRFYERKEIKDMLAYLKMIFNPADDLSLLRIINVPSRKIGAKTIEKLMSFSEQAKMEPLEYILAQTELLSGGLKKFAELITKIFAKVKHLTVRELIDYIYVHSGYAVMLDDGTEENRQRAENIKELLNVAEKYNDLEPATGLRSFLEEVALVENQASVDEKGNTDRPRITLMTTHSAKGLEFEAVFMVGVEEGIFPHSRALTNPSELDEERRLAYVAITRAKQKLFMSFATSRLKFGSRDSASPSRFLNDIDPDLIDFYSWNDNNPELYESSQPSFSNGLVGKSHPNSIPNSRNNQRAENQSKPSLNFNSGDRVRHAHFGNGKIKTIDHDYVVVSFDRHGEKELATEYAQLVAA